eukprot:TRINITY_DN2466_c2_g2_i4.p1 TRINITY_DN2466_c2_g2~~TRINITY_DN2466_c2_g2_i4.p1  ORF type:complete len:301 (-),score=44.88 TRINITY_DN2466_c2_g2_i4:20-922(-)
MIPFYNLCYYSLSINTGKLFSQIRGKKWFPASDNFKDVKRHLQYTRRLHKRELKQKLRDLESNVMADLSGVWQRMQGLEQKEKQFSEKKPFILTRKKRRFDDNDFDPEEYYNDSELDLTNESVVRTVLEIEQQLKQQEQEMSKKEKQKRMWHDWQTKKWKQYSHSAEFKAETFQEFVNQQFDEEEEGEQVGNDNDQYKDPFENNNGNSYSAYQKWQQWNKWRENTGKYRNRAQNESVHGSQSQSQQQQYYDNTQYQQSQQQQQQNQANLEKNKGIIRYLQVLGLPANIAQIDLKYSSIIT